MRIRSARGLAVYRALGLRAGLGAMAIVAASIYGTFAGCSSSSHITQGVDDPDNKHDTNLLAGGTGTWKVFPIASIPTAGTCTSACVTQLNADDGSYLKWIACSNGNNTKTEYTTPTDMKFTVTDPATIKELKVEIDGYGSGTNPAMVLECLNPSGQVIGTIASSFKPATTANLYTYPVPMSCMVSGAVTVRMRRTGSNCVGADVIRLMGRTEEAPKQVVRVPIQSIPTAGSCSTDCVTGLNADDGNYLKWLACSNGANTKTEYGTPTEMKFRVEDPTRVTEASFVMDAMGSAANALMRIECIDGAGASRGALFEGSFPTTAKTYEWGIPTACLAAGTPITIRITRTGNYCLGVDYAQVLVVYDGEPPPPPPPGPTVPAGYVNNTHAIEGYPDKISVAPGQTIGFAVHSPRPKFSIEFLRLGLSRSSLLTVNDIAGSIRHYPANVLRTGAGWPISYSLTIPSNWTTGMYAARLYSDDGAQFYVTFIVREANPGQQGARLGVLASTNTWEAYNGWGGGSYYGYTLSDGQGQTLSGGTVIAPIVPAARPNPAANPNGDGGHLANGEQHIIKWLEREGYRYGMLADMDFHVTPALLTKYSTIIINTHSEYWTKEMYNAIEAFLNQGGKVLYLSGNGIYWKVTWKNGLMEVRKNGTNHTQTGEAGGLRRNLSRPEARVLGVNYTGVGANTTAPNKVLSPSHWIFAGTGVASGTLIGNTGLNLFGGKASGWETDKRVSGQTPSNAVMIAQGTNASSGGAQMVYYDRAAGGSVFSVGSINFGGSLIVDNTLSTMVKNVLTRFGITK